MHYVDEGAGDETILCLHGEPTWSYLYRKMIPPLATAHRVVAPDMVGFGKSDKYTDTDDYSYHMHYNKLVGFIEALDLRRITLVCQDWGGLLGLVIAANHPDRFARLVALNTFLPTGEEKPSQGFMMWLRFSQKVGMRMQVGALDRAERHELRAARRDHRRLRRPLPRKQLQSRRGPSSRRSCRSPRAWPAQPRSRTRATNSPAGTSPPWSYSPMATPVPGRRGQVLPPFAAHSQRAARHHDRKRGTLPAGGKGRGDRRSSPGLHRADAAMSARNGRKSRHEPGHGLGSRHDSQPQRHATPRQQLDNPPHRQKRLASRLAAARHYHDRPDDSGRRRPRPARWPVSAPKPASPCARTSSTRWTLTRWT